MTVPVQQFVFDRRPETPADQAFAEALYAYVISVELQLVPWTEQQKQDFVRMQSKAQRHSYLARFPDAHCEIILVNGALTGRVWVGRKAEEIRLLDITLLPQAQGGGIGSRLIGELQQEAAASGKALRHCVHKTNPRALALYQRLGFKIIEDMESHWQMEWRKG